jgi:peptidylprolyl isomerase
VPTNEQRRAAARRHLERQLQHRQEREAKRKKVTMVASVAGSIVVIAAVVVAVVLIGGSDESSSAADPSGAPGTGPATHSAPSDSVSTVSGPSVHFHGVTVGGASDLSGEPQVASSGGTAPENIEYKDLVVGKGKKANPHSTVTVQYVGVLYKNGTEFDASWSNGKPTTFTLGPGHVIDGFTDGIGGTKNVEPMKVGGRRLIIIPASLAYGKDGNAGIPPNSPLVFVIDLKKVG